jgi:hypothetical protein
MAPPSSSASPRPRILLTNDDGIAAPGLEALYLALRDWADVEIVAPDNERSAVGHSVTIFRDIAYRRVQNLQTYFTRMGYALALPKKPKPAHAPAATAAATALAANAAVAAAADFRPGDIVTCTVLPNMEHLQHIMIISDRATSMGLPLVIHNIGQGAREENRLLEFPLTGHYRVANAEKAPSPPADAKERR